MRHLSREGTHIVHAWSTVELVLFALACAAAGAMWSSSFDAPAASCAKGAVQMSALDDGAIDFLFAPASAWQRLALEAELDKR